MKAFRVWLFLGLISACSSDNSPADGGTDASNDVTTQKDVANDTTQGSDTGTDAKNDVTTTDSSTTDSSTTDAKADASDAGLMYTLTINDYLNWCNVAVNGGDASTADPQTFQFSPDASVSLAGDTANVQLFYWGYWQSAAIGDGGKDTNKSASLTMNGNVNVLACCPLNNTALSCP